MKQKHSDLTRVSNLPLKMLFFSYFNNHQSIQLMSDCHNAINDKITRLSQMIEENFEEISAIVGDDNADSRNKLKNNKQVHQMMEVIEQEDYWTTERSNQQRENTTERNRNLLVKKFNSMIGMLEKSSDKFGEIMFMYKNQIKEIAKDLTKERELNVKFKRQTEERGKSNKEAMKEGRSSSIGQVKAKKTTVAMVSKSRSVKKPTLPTKPLGIPRQAQQSQDEQARPPPKPFCQECMTREKQQIQREKIQQQEKNKWRQLSTKISNLKSQLSRYEQELMGNQVEISRLNEELRKKTEDNEKTQSQEKRKIKTINTTLRGQKIVLQNQVQSLKKKLQQTTEHITTLQTQNHKLHMQKDNLQSTIKWHTNTIEDLRNNFSSGIKQEGQLLNQYNQVKQQNLLLAEQITSHEKYLQQFVDNLKTVQDSFKKEIQQLNTRIHELQDIIQQKNETIIRLKLGKHQTMQPKPLHDPSSLSQTNKQLTFSRQNRCANKQSIVLKRDTQLSGTIMNKTIKRDPLTSGYTANNENFQDNMIKVLNKKLAIKQCEIEKLQSENEVLRAQLQVYKEME